MSNSKEDRLFWALYEHLRIIHGIDAVTLAPYRGTASLHQFHDLLGCQQQVTTS